LALLLALAFLPGGPGVAADLSPAELHKARELVRQLGDSSFEVRERAGARLFQMGTGVKQVLLEGSRDPDPEVRRRCRDLLPAVLEADRRARLAAFLADKEGKQRHDLPGWERFRKLAGEGRAARELFAEIQKGDSVYFLQDVDRHPEKAGSLCEGRCQDLQQKLYGGFRGGQPLALHEVAAVLLVAADPKVSMPGLPAYTVGNFLYQSSARTALTVGPQPSPFRKLVLAWMRRQAADDNGIYQALQVATNLNLNEGLDLAVEAARARKLKGQPLAKVLTVIGKLGTREHLRLLELHLTDTTVVGNFGLNNGRGVTEVRDVALAMMVHLTGQEHKDYGFLFSRNHPSLKFHEVFLGFSTTEERDQAFRKWKEWSAKKK
jgi:hypothetical protein